jgi:hypothetical protein
MGMPRMVEMLMTWASGESNQSIRPPQPELKTTKLIQIIPKEKFRQIRISQKDLQKIITCLEEL